MRLIIRYECDSGCDSGRDSGRGAVCEWVLQGADLDPPDWNRIAHVFGELYLTMQLGCVGEEITGHRESCACAYCLGGAA